ncbi:S-layer homology domain-containing protein [Paenibacillus sp. FSL R7-0331]|uniref:S-layer homology domain-containing protein n=1 Tax=Paenibacillus sp. FSL R7-0331 TaxID=1536773 RepID=UPI000693EC28|nr:S-layer homology domain-containing protein [Paenibacillus sp. FSL R7-0331]
MKKLSFQARAKKLTIACGILAATVSMGTSAFAFSDMKGDANEAKINALHSEGIVNGVTSDLFAPKAKVTFAQGVQFIVSGLKLSPTESGKASDYFDKVKDNAWYASAFVAAKQNGLALDKTVDPNGSITRAQFAHLLTQALQSKGDFPVTMMYAMVSDGDKMTNEQMNSLQILYNTRIVSLGANGTFRPTEAVTRTEAAVWIYDAAKFAKEVITPDDSAEAPAYEYDSEVKLEKAADGISKATVTVNNLPNPGYGLAIDRIEFGKDKTAVIYFSVTKPDPNSMYPQVISSASAVTYLPEGYTATVQASDGSAAGSSSAIKLQ